MDSISKSSVTRGDANLTIQGKSNDIYTNLWFKGSLAALQEACIDKLYINSINDLPFPPPAASGGEYPTLAFSPNGVANQKPTFNNINDLMAQVLINQTAGLITVINFNTSDADVTLSGTLDFNGCIITSTNVGNKIKIPTGVVVNNPLEIKDAVFEIESGGKLVFNDATRGVAYIDRGGITCPALTVDEARVIFDETYSVVVFTANLSLDDTLGVHCFQIAAGKRMDIFCFDMTFLRQVFYFPAANGGNALTWWIDASTGVANDLKVVPNAALVTVNILDKSSGVAYDDTKVAPPITADNVQDALDALKQRKELYTDIYVDNDIPATAEPTYKTLEEAAVYSLAHPNVSLNVYIKKCETITKLIVFNKNTRMIGVGDKPGVIFGDNGIVNEVESWDNFSLLFNAAVLPANVFNNSPPATFKFKNCTIEGQAPKNTPVLYLLGNMAGVYFEDCNIVGFPASPNKVFLAATDTNSMSGVFLKNTIMPETALCTFNNTGSGATFDVSVDGLATTKTALAANIIGANVNYFYNSPLDNVGNVLITAPADGQVLSYELASTTWKNKKVAVADVDGITVNTAVGYDGSAMTLANGTLSNVQRSEIASVYNFYFAESTPNPLVVPEGYVMFLNADDLITQDTNFVSKIYISFTNTNGVDLFGSGYMKNIDVGGDKVSLLVRGLYDEAMAIRGSISFVNVNEIANQWEITLNNYNPTYSMMFSQDAGLSVSLGSPDQLVNLLDFNITPLLAPNQVVGWNGLSWTNMDAAANTSAITKEPTGFDHPENVIVSYDSATRIVTLGGANWTAYWRGVAVPELIPGWTSLPHEDAPNSYFFYWDDEGLIVSTTPWNFDKMQICFVDYQTAYKFALRECHSLMPWQVHEEMHRVIGTYLKSGADVSAYVLNSTTANDRRPDLSEAHISDEDLPTVVPQLLKTDNTNAPYAWFSLTDANTPEISFANAEIINLNAGVPRYNLYTGGVWTQADFTNNAYGKIFVLALPVTSDVVSQFFRYIFVQPQQISASLNTVQSVSFSSVNFGTFVTTVPEFIPVAEIIIRYQGGNWHLTSVTKITGTKQVLSSSTAVGLTAVSTDGTTITGNGTPADPLVAIQSGGGISPMVEISNYAQFSVAVSQFNIGDPTILNVANPIFNNNNASLPINPTWSQHGTYPSAVTFNPQKPVTIKVDWSLDVESFPAQTFDIGYGFINGTMTAIDRLRTGTKVYSGSFIRYYDALTLPPILFYFALRCTTAQNQTVTINKFNYTITCDRVVQ